MANTGHRLSQIGAQGWRKENASRKAAKVICSTTRCPHAPCAACHGFLDVIRARLLWRSPTESVLSSVVVAWNPLAPGRKPCRRHWNYPFEREPQTGDGSAVEIAPGVCGLRMPLFASLPWINVWAIAEDGGWSIVERPPLGRMAPEDGVAFYRAAGWDHQAIERYKEKFGSFGQMIFPLPASYRRISDGDILRLGAHDWTVVVGSGHCPEHACLYCPQLKLLISGDQVRLAFHRTFQCIPQSRKPTRSAIGSARCGCSNTASRREWMS